MNTLLGIKDSYQTYNAAINNYAAHMASGKQPKYDIFTVSAILAIAFGVLKEKTFEDVLEQQRVIRED